MTELQQAQPTPTPDTAPLASSDPLLYDEHEVDRFLGDHGDAYDPEAEYEGDDDLPEVDVNYADWILRRKAVLRGKKRMVVEALEGRVKDLLKLLQAEERDIIAANKQPTQGNEELFEQIVKAETQVSQLLAWARKLLKQIDQEDGFRDRLLEKFWHTHQDCIVTSGDGVGNCELPSGTIRIRRLADVAHIANEPLAIEYALEHDIPMLSTKTRIDKKEAKLFLTSTGERYAWGWLETGRTKFEVEVKGVSKKKGDQP